MSVVLPFLAFLLAGAFAAYHRLRLWLWAAITGLLLLGCWLLGENHRDPRRRGDRGAGRAAAADRADPQAVHHRAAAEVLPKLLPPLSDTERTALESGTVGFEGELFSGKPAWDKLLNLPKPELSAEEQAFLDGPCEEPVPQHQRLGNHPRPRRPAAGDVGLPQAQQVLRHDRAEGIRRPRLFRTRQPQGDPEDRLDLLGGELHRRRTELARPGGSC